MSKLQSHLSGGKKEILNYEQAVVSVKIFREGGELSPSLILDLNKDDGFLSYLAKKEWYDKQYVSSALVWGGVFEWIFWASEFNETRSNFMYSKIGAVCLAGLALYQWHLGDYCGRYEALEKRLQPHKYTGRYLDRMVKRTAKDDSRIYRLDFDWNQVRPHAYVCENPGHKQENHLGDTGLARVSRFLSAQNSIDELVDRSGVQNDNDFADFIENVRVPAGCKLQIEGKPRPGSSLDNPDGQVEGGQPGSSSSQNSVSPYNPERHGPGETHQQIR